MPDLLEHYLDAHTGKPRTELTARRAEIITRTAELEGYSRRSQAQADELDGLIAEQIAVDDLIKRTDVEIRRAEIDRITRMAADESNLERPGGTAPGRRWEPVSDVQRTARDAGYSAAAFRSGNPWEAAGGGPLGRESMTGLISRAHSILEMTESVPADSREAFAAMLDDLDADNGAGPEAQRAAQYAVATSDPEYLSAVRAVIRDPRRGTLRWTDAQRAAFDRVETVAARLGIAETEYASRAMSLSPGTAGGLLVPFTLDPTIAISNSGSANPYRRLATIKQTTTNAFNGVSSPGVNAAWVAEGVASTDNSPTLAAITIPNFKGTAWCFGSYELIGDSNFGEQLPRLLADAKDRLEENAFTLGNGTSQAKGIITAATTLVQTATAGTFVFGDIYKIWEQVPPRFRVADSARPAWVTTLVNLDRMRQMPPATGFLTSIVNDLTSDQIPEVLGTDIYESTSMVSTLTAGSKIAVVGSWDNYWIADRLGSSIIYEPIITATADSRMPIGSAGWYLFWRTGADAAVPGAFRTLTT